MNITNFMPRTELEKQEVIEYKLSRSYKLWLGRKWNTATPTQTKTSSHRD